MNKRKAARRTLIGFLAAFNLVIGAVGSYALYTRAGAPSFSRGGAFGVPAPASSSATSARRVGHKAAAPALPGTRAGGAHLTSGTRTVAAPVPGVIDLPRAGTYRFAGSGHESIEFAGGSPCSWDVSDVTAVAKSTTDGEVFDWTYAAQRQQRNIFTFARNGVYTTFIGAAVTCVVRKTNDETYDPAALRLESPLASGAHWRSVAHSTSRTENMDCHVLAHRAFTVPAGTFDAYEIRFDVGISGGQTGTVTETMWFAPALGTEIWNHVVTDVTQSGAHFASDITLKLTALP